MRRRILSWRFAGVAIAALVLSFWVIATLFPRPVAGLLLAGVRLSAGLESKTIETEFGPVGYLEGGEGPTVVLLHGIYARKEHWVDLTRELTDAYHVIVPDLPGFGDNPVLGMGAYDYEAQVKHLLLLFSALGIDEYHLAGNSMGGQLTGMLAERSPEKVLSIAFIGSTAGVKSPEPSEMELAISEGQIPLVVTRETEFYERMNWLFPKAPYIPGPVLKLWAEDEVRLAEDNLRIWQEVDASETLHLDALAPHLNQPALIVWCREDRIFDISGATTLSGLLPNDELVELSGCGHVPMLDKPVETGQAYRNFLDGLIQ